jgi:hypothetical protein
LLDILKIRIVVGLDPEFATFQKASVNCLKKFIIHDAARLVSPFWPWIRKIQMKAPD